MRVCQTGSLLQFPKSLSPEGIDNQSNRHYEIDAIPQTNEGCVLARAISRANTTARSVLGIRRHLGVRWIGRIDQDLDRISGFKLAPQRRSAIFRSPGHALVIIREEVGGAVLVRKKPFAPCPELGSTCADTDTPTPWRRPHIRRANFQALVQKQTVRSRPLSKCQLRLPAQAAPCKFQGIL
jgi:hypothetical protein